MTREHLRSWPEIRAELGAVGLNALGVADGAPYQGWLPGCRSVVVVGSGGPALWDQLVAGWRADPRAFATQRDPLDRFVRERVAEARADGPGRRWVFADGEQQPAAPMQELALAAGFGWRSRLWLVLHPEFGTWLGLRAACFTVEALPIDGPRREASPCEGCPAPCVVACPGGALRGPALDWKRSALHRATTDDCLDRCHARQACPMGAAHQYSALEHLYHHDKERGRAAIAALLGVDDEAPAPARHWTERARQATRLLRRR